MKRSAAAQAIRYHWVMHTTGDDSNCSLPNAPLIGISADNVNNSAASGKYESPIAYSRVVAQAGGVAVLLPHEVELAGEYARRCDGIILTGGVDPDTTPFGAPVHEKARLIDPCRQAFETQLLRILREHAPAKPVLGVCLGMQLMALDAGGALHQYLPDVLVNPQLHQHNNRHGLVLVGAPTVLCDSSVDQSHAKLIRVVSYHQQAVSDPGKMHVVATAVDGVIEAIDDPDRAFYLGVQWHPERGVGAVSHHLLHRFVAACQPSTART